MPLPSARRTHRLCHRAIVTLVAASLLSMPVTYRGGAEAAHAHTIFQLWEDVRTGSFTHHGAAADAERHRHAASHAGAATQAESDDERAVDERGVRDHVMGGDASSTASPGLRRGRADVGVAGVRGAVGAASVAVDEDAPTVGSAFTPDVRGSVLVLTVTGAMAATGAPQPVAERSARLAGRVLTPVAPPPRTAA